MLKHGVDEPAGEDDYLEIDRAVRQQIAEFGQQAAALQQQIAQDAESRHPS